MNKTVKLVKVQILPYFVIENENGAVASDVQPKEPLTVYASDTAEISRLLNEIQTRITTDVLALKS
jgi:hypothetical protein